MQTSNEESQENQSEDRCQADARAVRRGFAALDPARVREIASKGGQAAHAKGSAHKFTTEEARAAGKKGGSAPHHTRGRAKKDG